MVKDW